MFRRIKRPLAYTVSGASLVYCTLRYVCGIGKCEDVSMEPVIQHGDVVLLTPFNVAQNKISKGDVVFCRAPKDARSVICKRVKGLQGDVVDNEDTGHREFVKKGHVWLEGDNKDASIDSRAFGSVPYGLLISKVSLRLWPPSRIGVLSLAPEVEQPQAQPQPESE